MKSTTTLTITQRNHFFWNHFRSVFFPADKWEKHWQLMNILPALMCTLWLFTIHKGSMLYKCEHLYRYRYNLRFFFIYSTRISFVLHMRQNNCSWSLYMLVRCCGRCEILLMVKGQKTGSFHAINKLQLKNKFADFQPTFHVSPCNLHPDIPVYLSAKIWRIGLEVFGNKEWHAFFSVSLVMQSLRFFAFYCIDSQVL